MRIIIHTEAQYAAAFREMAKAVKAQVEEIADEEPAETSRTVDELIAVGLIEPAQVTPKKSLSDALNQFSNFPLTYEDARALRRDAWKRNG